MRGESTVNDDDDDRGGVRIVQRPFGWYGAVNFRREEGGGGRLNVRFFSR